MDCLINDPFKKVIAQNDVLMETDTEYLPYGKFSAGEVITSIVLPDFSIPVKAIFDSEANLRAIQEVDREINFPCHQPMTG